MATFVKECPTRVFVLSAPMREQFEVRYYTSARQLAQAVVNGHGQGLTPQTRELSFGRAYVLTDGTTSAADLTDLCVGVYDHAAGFGSSAEDRKATAALAAAITARVG